MTNEVAAYAGLFAAAFLAATILPAQSEALLVGLLLSGKYDTWALLAWATAGNTLGAGINYGLGRLIERFRDRRWFPVSPAAFDRAARWYRRYGVWTLLLSWAPLGGDALTVAAGAARTSPLLFALLVLVAKGGRYLVLAWVTLQWSGS